MSMIPEQHILLAVIQQAITDATERPIFKQGPMTDKRRKARKAKFDRWMRDRDSAIDWLFDQHGSADVPFSLEWCCSWLNMNPGIVRERVRNMPTLYATKGTTYHALRGR